MCEICMQNPCANRCPNAPEPIPEKVCVACGEGIFEGDKYFESLEGPMCVCCMEEKSYEEILDIFGERMRTA